MGLWQVYYEGWQMECCGEPFAVGEEVRWPLQFHDADDVLSGGWSEELSRLAGPVEEVPDGEGGPPVRVLRDETGLTAALFGEQGADAGPGDRIRRVGMLTVERHSGEWPEARGRVRAIRLVTQVYEETEPGSTSWRPASGPGTRRLRSIGTCPKRFRDSTHEAEGREGMEAGVLVTLEVPTPGAAAEGRGE
ncbi:DUF6578 domain-containing protein [Streptomyces sp. NPDC001617]